MQKERFTNLDNTRDSQLAAALIALDVPQNAKQPFTTMAGDGIKGKRFTWHFNEYSLHGEKTSDIIRHWIDEAWIASNSENILAKIKRMFARHAEYADFCKGKRDVITLRDAVGHECHDIYQAASMEELGHPRIGARRTDTGYRWIFPVASGVDMAIWKEMTEWRDDQFRADNRADIAYLFCASKMHKTIINELVCLRAQFAKIDHGKKSLAIGKDASPRMIEFFERKLYSR